MRDAEFLALLELEQGRLYRAALGILGNPADAADALSDAVADAYANLPGLRGGAAAFGAWIRRILVRRCCAVLRQRRRVTVAEQPAEWLEPEPPPPDALSPGEVWAAVAALDEQWRPVLVLHYGHGYSLDEVAALLGVAPGTVRSRLHRALARLRRELAAGPAAGAPAGGRPGHPAARPSGRPDHDTYLDSLARTFRGEMGGNRRE